MTTSNKSIAWCLMASLMLSACVTAPVETSGVQIDRDEQRVLASDAFLDAHPDLKHRLQGWNAYDEGRFEEAIGHFREAASYADKLSQAMLAEMYWNGRGVPVDRPLAYAWADLAAERGYLQFVGLRERYWQALDADQRAQALERGQPLLQQYGDDAAKPRMAEALRDARRYMAGGMIRRNSTINLPGPNGWISVRGHDFYAVKFWRPKRYQAWHDKLYHARYDKLWHPPVPTGTVTVRELETIQDAPPPAQDDALQQQAPDPAE